MILYPIPGKYNLNESFDVSIVIPMYKSKKVIKEQIRRWPTTDSGLKTEIIYVNDCCPENSCQSVMQEWNKRKDKNNFNVKLVLNQTNKGFGESCNTGVHYSKGKYIIFLNADAIPEPNWLNPIFEIFENNKDVGIVGNLQLKDGGEFHGTIDSAGSEWVWEETNFVHIGRHILNSKFLEKPIYPEELPQELNCVSEREMVTGCCLAIKKEIFDHVGGFNHYYRIGYWEDSELCMSVRELGYKIMFTPDSIVWHKLSHSKIGAHVFHDINKQYFMNKWDSSGRIEKLINSKRPINRQEVKRILVKREAANGDVLTSTCILPGLKEKYPNAKIDFCTGCGQVLYKNPYINKIVGQYEAFNNLHKYQLVIELDGAYERRPNLNFIQAYCDEAGVDSKLSKLFIHSEKLTNNELPENYIVIHAGMTNWVGRNWDIKKFEFIANKLLENNFNVICIGKGADRLVPCTLDLRSRISLFEMSYVIKNAKFFVGIDSMPMHIAQVNDTPGICFFGSVLPQYRLYNKKMLGINAKDVPCIGCHHKNIAPSTSLNKCKTGNLDCEKQLSAETMWSLIKNQLGIKNAT